MIPLPYRYVRWAIVVVAAVIVVVWYLFAFFHPGLIILLAVLLILTAMSWIVPPGIYPWLVRGVCPTCGKTVEWAATHADGKAYQEQIVVRCPGCNKQQVEWRYVTDR